MHEDVALTFMAALVKRLGGNVSFTHKELMDAQDLCLYRSEDRDSFTGGIEFSVEDDTIIQGVLVDVE